jgi:hypothetical protein
MRTIIYSDETGTLLTTVEASDAIKDQLFDASLDKTRWLVNSRCRYVSSPSWKMAGSCNSRTGPRASPISDALRGK